MSTYVNQEDIDHYVDLFSHHFNEKKISPFSRKYIEDFFDDREIKIIYGMSIQIKNGISSRLGMVYNEENNIIFLDESMHDDDKRIFLASLICLKMFFWNNMDDIVIKLDDIHHCDKFSDDFFKCWMIIGFTLFPPSEQNRFEHPIDCNDVSLSLGLPTALIEKVIAYREEKNFQDFLFENDQYYDMDEDDDDWWNFPWYIAKFIQSVENNIHIGIAMLFYLW